MVIRRRWGSTAHFGPRPLAAVVACVALLAAGCTSSGLGAGDAATVAEGFVAELAVDGGAWETVEEGAKVPEGARVRATDSDVVLEFRDGAVHLAPGSSAVVDSDRVQLDSGEVLIDGSGPLGALVGDTTVTGSGVFRVSSGLSARVGVYEGSATVRRPAQEREVPALRQLELAGLRLDAVAEPLQYREDDTWDQDLLADAIAFDGEAARLTSGIDIEIGRAPLRPRFYAELAGRDIVKFLPTAATIVRRGAFGPPSDVLLTVFVSRAAAQPVSEAVRHVADLRDAGARWGLIARELQVESDTVVAAIDDLGSDDELTVAARNAAIRRSEPARRNARGDAASAVRDTSTAVADATGSGSSTSSTSSTSSGSTSGGSGTTSGTSSGGTTSGGGGGGDDGGGGGGGGSGGGETTVTDVVTDVVNQVPNPVGDDENTGEKSPVGSVRLPPAPDLPGDD